MLTTRLIPCLDVKDGRVVKGVRFVDLTDEGDPVELAAAYAREGADELVFLDIGASPEGRGITLDMVRRTASEVFIPLTVAGGVRSPDDMRAVLRAGADKVGVNTAAVADPDLLAACAARFGSQCVVLSIDARATDEGRWEVVVNGGRTPTGLDAVEWARRGAALGAGELLVTSIDRDGTKSGFDVGLLAAIRAAVEVPIVASGGAGTAAHCVEAVTVGGADAVLAASIFHRRELTIAEVKHAMADAGVAVRRATTTTSPTPAVPMRPDVPSWSDLRPGVDGLVTAVVQDTEGAVRMVGHLSEESYATTVATGLVTFWSRSRATLWTKGEESGNLLRVVTVAADCDGDAVLVTAEPVGPTCHTGTTSCFGDTTASFGSLDVLWATVADRAATRPEGSYTTSLLEGGPEATGRKVVEEATEVLLAAKDHASGLADDQRLAEEAADLLYHLMVVLAERGIAPATVIDELRSRRRDSGHG